MKNIRYSYNLIQRGVCLLLCFCFTLAAEPAVFAHAEELELAEPIAYGGLLDRASR